MCHPNFTKNIEYRAHPGETKNYMFLEKRAHWKLLAFRLSLFHIKMSL